MLIPAQKFLKWLLTLIKAEQAGPF